MRFLLSIICVIRLASLALGGGGGGGGGNNDNLRDVCIIGGGGSGSAAAVFLRDLNKDVVIIESQSNLGGHCDTVRFPGGWNEAGVVVYPDTAFATAAGCGPWDFDMKAYVKRFAGNDSILPAFFDGLPGFIGDYSTGFFLGPTPPVPITPDFLTDYARLATLMRTELLYLDTLLEVPNPIPASFRVSFNQWIATNNFTSIYSTFLYPLYYAGLGDFDRLTAWDGLLQRTCTNLLADTPGAWFSVKNGCQTVYDGILNFLGAERVRFNASITQVVRPRRVTSRNPIIIRGTQVGRNGRPVHFVERCRNLIVSVAQTLENLTPFMDLTFFERQVFKDISTRYYFSGIYDVEGGIAASSGNYTFTNVNVTSPLGLPVFPAVVTSFRKFPAGPGVVQSYSSDPITTSAMKTIVQGQLNNVQAGGAFTSITNFQIWPHRYNPHWSREALGNPFLSPYNQWDQLQGIRNTYYIGAARHTPSSAVIINYVKNIIDEYFA